MTNTTKAVEVLKTNELERVQTPVARRAKLLDEFVLSGLSGPNSRRRLESSIKRLRSSKLAS